MTSTVPARPRAQRTRGTLVQELREFRQALHAALGMTVNRIMALTICAGAQTALDLASKVMREAPDMFPKEKYEISNFIVKFSSSSAEILTVNRIMALTICAGAQTALDLASKVMDMAGTEGLGLGATAISKTTTNQMVRAYASVFCNAAKDAYRKRIKMETILSFLDALRGLGEIFRIAVQETVTKNISSLDS
ncbi:hypothetical protein ACP70R_038147 [Stipagrostis hirtigluma subsp. patula]